MDTLIVVIIVPLVYINIKHIIITETKHKCIICNFSYYMFIIIITVIIKVFIMLVKEFELINILYSLYV